MPNCLQGNSSKNVNWHKMWKPWKGLEKWNVWKINFNDDIHELLPIRGEIQSCDTRFFKSANHIKSAYNGVEDDDIPKPVLEVLDEKLLEKKDEVNRGNMKGYRSALNLFEKWMKAAHLFISLCIEIILIK